MREIIRIDISSIATLLNGGMMISCNGDKTHKLMLDQDEINDMDLDERLDELNYQVDQER